MKKLEEIPKKQVFSVPERYFDNLPARIQARLESKSPVQEPGFVFRYRLQYVVPILVLLAIGIYWFYPAQPKDVETLLASVETEDLIAYLNESDLTTQDVLEYANFNATDVEQIESKVYELNFEDEELNELQDLDLENI